MNRILLQHKHNLPILLEIPVVFVIVWQLWSKAFPLWVYLLASTFLGVLVAICLLVQRKHQTLVFMQIFLFAILVRSVYFVATRYQVIPFGDSYDQFGVLKSFLADDKVYIIDAGGGKLVR